VQGVADGLALGVQHLVDALLDGGDMVRERLLGGRFADGVRTWPGGGAVACAAAMITWWRAACSALTRVAA
jgi:hypothetical protein